MTASRFTIYCHTNRVNGKRYVGQTVYSMEKRWSEHVSRTKNGLRGCTVFQRAIAKHGADTFDHEVLETVDSQTACDLAELKWIDRFQSRAPNGYNLKSGGNGGRQHEETVRSIKASWANMTLSQKSARVRKMRSNSVKSDASRSEKTTAWQTEQAKRRTSKQRREIVLKSWVTRRATYGDRGHSKRHGEIGNTSRKTWAKKTPEALADHGQKIREGHRRGRDQKNSRLVRINLLSSAIQ
jgi:group I intron endonuclease